MFYDCHTHSTFSADGKMSVLAACQRAVDLGLKGLAFTDHVDFDVEMYPDLLFDPRVRLPEITQARLQYKNRLQLIDGVELGFQSQVLERTRQFVKAYPYDFVILSTHAIDGLDFCDTKFHEKYRAVEACHRYLDAILQSIEFDDFDVVGHIGYVLRYVKLYGTFREVEGSREQIDAILTGLVNRGKGIEINTSGYRHEKIAETTPADFIVRRFHELGGEIVTLGSDAHVLEHVGFEFKRGAAMLRSCGFNHVAYFIERKPVFVLLNL